MRELKWLQPIAKVLGIAQNTPTHKLGDCDMMTTLKKKTLYMWSALVINMTFYDRKSELSNFAFFFVYKQMLTISILE